MPKFIDGRNPFHRYNIRFIYGNRKFSTVILKSPNFAHSYEIPPPS